MPIHYRKKRGPFTFSASRRGPRVSIGLGGGRGGSGCLLTVLAVLVVLLALA